jgi:2-oxoglutarate ferredoxin oxidoreductase subunit beta
MSTVPAPPPKKTNRIGLEVLNYPGSKTTLCAGCGHNAVSERLVECFFEMGIESWRVAKFSGIGCSSKSPAYFLSMAHGFNSVHGRAPAVSTGAMLANKNLLGIVVTGAKSKSGVVNKLQPEDCCVEAIQIGATFVARSSSGDKKQLQALLKTAISHRGLPVIDVISPCVTFNDHEGSTKSYSYMKDHEEPLHELDFVPYFQDIEVEIEEGAVQEIEMHDGSRLRLHKLEHDYDPTDRLKALTTIQASKEAKEVLTGVLYLDAGRENFLELLNTVDEPLATLPQSKTRPPREVLDELMEELR